MEQRADARMQEMIDELTLALQSGTIDLGASVPEPPVFAGGINYCPNSDFKFSKLAIETPGTLPGDAGDENHECYRFYRQEEGDDVVLIIDPSQALKAVDHSTYAANEGADAAIPIWNRVNGWLEFGSDGDAWDVAAHLYNNDIKPGDTWYVRFVLAALTEDLVPDDLEMYCGFWHETSGGQGWIEGGNFELTYEIVGIAGTAEYNYMVEAKTDSGFTLYSQVLNVTDAPDTINGSNFVRLSYSSVGGGFIEFKIYRETVASGDFHQIAHIRNANVLLWDDQGENLMPAGGFPTGSPGPRRAIAYSRSLAVGTQGGTLLMNDFAIRIPDDYNWSETLPMSQFLRFGFTRTCAVDRQILLDRIYLGPSFNQWSDSPFDAAGAIPSTSQTGGSPTGGGGTSPPEPGSGGPCIRIDTPVLRIDFDGGREWLPYKEVPDGDLLENGQEERNLVLSRVPGRGKTVVTLHFSNGAWLPSNPAHRIRINEEGDCRAARDLNEGDTVWGWTDGKAGPVTVTKKRLRTFKGDQQFGTFTLRGQSSDGDHFYIAGFSDDGNSGVFNHNVKSMGGGES